LVFLLAFWPKLALAHAYPVASQPAANSTVQTAPAVVTISFSEAVEPALSSLEVYDDQRRSATSGPAVVDSADPRLLRVPLRAQLPDGTYTVVWHVVSADDGHSTAGVFAFGVGQAAQAPVVSPRQLGAASGQTATVPGVVGRFLVYLGALILLGVSLFVLLIRGPAEAPTPASRSTAGATSTDPNPADRAVFSPGPLVSLLAVALVTLLAGQLLRLLDEQGLASSSPLGPPAPPGLDQLILASRFGALWLVRGGIALAGLAVVVIGRKANWLSSPWVWRGSAFLGFALVADLVVAGHAASGNVLAYFGLIQSTLGWSAVSPFYLPAAAALLRVAQPLTLVIAGLHLVAVAAWVGGLVALGTLPLSPYPSPTWGEGSQTTPLAAPLSLQRFSRLATAAMLTVLITGLYNTWLYLAAPASYVATGYGQSLLLKHVGVVAMLLAAGLNHFVTVPLLVEGSAPRWLAPGAIRFIVERPLLPVRIEAGFAVVVLLSTGVLTSLGPARQADDVLLDPSRELALANVPFQALIPLADGESAQLTLDPGRVGPNHYAVKIVHPGQPANPVQRVYLTLAPAGDPLGTAGASELAPAGSGAYEGQGLLPSSSGRWIAQVQVDFLDGAVAIGRVTFQSTPEWAAAADPRAADLLASAAGAMEQLRSARIVEILGNGAAGVVLDTYTFAAPDREEIATPAGATTIQIGDQVYTRDSRTAAWRAGPGPGYTWPRGAFGYLAEGVGALDVGQGSLGGVDCTVVAFYSPRISGLYEEWIGNQDHLIHQEVMAAPAHYMVNRFDDFNRAPPITPPSRTVSQ
jgi:copper transport protein